MDYYNPNAISSLEEGDDQDSINEHASGFQEDFPMDSLGHVNPYFQDDGDIEMQTNGLRQRDPYMEGAKPRRTRALSTASSMQYSSEEEDPDDIVESAAIAASLRDPHSMLDLLPSRQLGSTLIVAHASKKWLKTRQSTRGTLSVKKGRHNSGTRVAVERIVNNEDMVDGSARSLIRRQNTIKAIPGSIETKRRIRDKVEKKKSKKDKSVSYFTMLSYNIGMSWQTVKNKLKDLKYSTNFWDGHIKKIEGNFGSGVTSYFLFLRWLLLLNIPVFLLSFSFATIPQLIYEPSPLYNTASFSVLDLFTGMGWFTDTELYYGYYTNETFTTNDKHYYDMPVAYLFTCGGYSLFLLVALLISMSEAYKASYVLGSGNFNFYVTKIFCSWDYNITAKKSAALKQKSIYLELAERLSSQHDKKVYTKCEIFGIWMGRLGTNLLVLALIAGAGAAVVVGYEEKIGEQEQFGDLTVLIMPLIICGLNFVLPPIFSFISNYENYRSPRVKLYITMARTILLNAVLFIVLIHFWLERSGCKTVDMYTPSSGAANETSITNISTTPSMYVNTTKNPVVCIENCWETEFGQELYRLVIIDFIFLLISTFFVEFMMRIFSDYCCKTRSRPEFDIARNTMELIQSQTLTWLGLFYSPLLVFICIIKLIVLFYVKRYSVIGNCTPSLKPWRAGRTTTVFLGMLLCMFFLAAGTVCYSMVSIESSNECGPFRDLVYMYDVVTELLEEWADSNTLNAIYVIIDLLMSPGTVLIVAILLSLLVYYFSSIATGSKQLVAKLRVQIGVEGKDKMFLLKLLQDRVKQLPVDAQLEYKASLTNPKSGEHNGSAFAASHMNGVYGSDVIRSTAAIEADIDDYDHHQKYS